MVAIWYRPLPWKFHLLWLIVYSRFGLNVHCLIHAPPPTLETLWIHLKGPLYIPTPRSGREDGLHQSALAQGFGLKCRIARMVIPMKTSSDDDTPEMTSWPFLLPEDFEPCYWLGLLGLFLKYQIHKFLFPISFFIPGKNTRLVRGSSAYYILGKKSDWSWSFESAGWRFHLPSALLAKHETWISGSPRWSWCQKMDIIHWMHTLLYLAGALK